MLNESHKAEISMKSDEILTSDMPARAAKTGMLYSKEIMEVVAGAIDQYELRVVVDPVFQAGTGELLDQRGGKGADL